MKTYKETDSTLSELRVGAKFVRSLPQTTDEDVRLYTPFIVECMQWGQ